jgi:hypothetical protein
VKFRKKPVVVEAEQFTIGNHSIEGMIFVPVSIRYSRDEQLYYIVDGNHRPKNWVAVNKDEEGKYEVYPFAFYEIKSGKEVSIDDPEWKSELYERYIQEEDWEEGSLPYGIVETLEGGMIAHYGDWIIKGVKGELYPCKPDIFESTYEPVN